MNNIKKEKKMGCTKVINGWEIIGNKKANPQ